MKDGRRGFSPCPRCRAFDRISSRWSLTAEASKIHEHVNPDRPTGSWTCRLHASRTVYADSGCVSLGCPVDCDIFEFGGSYR